MRGVFNMTQATFTQDKIHNASGISWLPRQSVQQSEKLFLYMREDMWPRDLLTESKLYTRNPGTLTYLLSSITGAIGLPDN